MILQYLAWQAGTALPEVMQGLCHGWQAWLWASRRPGMGQIRAAKLRLAEQSCHHVLLSMYLITHPPWQAKVRKQ